MFKVAQINAQGVIAGVWYQSASSAQEALITVKNYYAHNIKGSRFTVESI